MGVVLAIDPGRRQGQTLDRLTREFSGHDVVIATSGDEALAVLDGLLPDLVMFPLFLAPADDSKLQAKLQALDGRGDRRALTIPLRAFFDGEREARRPAAVPPRWFYWFRPTASADAAMTHPRAFADAVRADLDRPRVPAAIASTVDPAVADAPSQGYVPAGGSVGPAIEPSRPAALAETPVPFPAAPAAAIAPSPPQAPPAAPAVASPLFAASAHARPDPPAISTPATQPGPGAPAPMGPSSPPPVASPYGGAQYGSMFGATGAEMGATDEPAAEDGHAGGARAALGALASGAGAGARGAGRALSALASALPAAWRFAQGMPRAVQVGAPAAVILLTLGMTGQVGPLLSAPGRWASAARQRWFPETPKTGTAEIQTVPDGAQVWYQGRQLGVTPLRFEFAVGTHEVELRYRNTTRTVQLDVTAGNTFVQRIEWAAPRVTGKLRVESDPTGAAVAVDGRPRGVTPLNVDDLAAGGHTVDVTMNGNIVHETVEIKGGKTATIRTSIYQGWLALFSPIDLKVALDGRPLTLDDQNRAMVPSGAHQLTLQNRALGYTDTRTIEIRPGDTTAVSIVLPKTTLSVTTSSPAEVWVDGERAGESPVTDFPVDIGTRSILVRSAEHGERQATVTATTSPVRVTIDFSSSAP